MTWEIIRELVAVGVTVRAVRHYHAVGLLPEPERDASGYRRYGAQAVADLARIRTLAEAGVPLSRVQTLLRATPEEFARAVEEIDRNLREEIERLERSRERVARPSSGDALVLPPAVVAQLDLLRSLGVSERGVAMEREGWIVLSARLRTGRPSGRRSSSSNSPTTSGRSSPGSRASCRATRRVRSPSTWYSCWTPGSCPPRLPGRGCTG